MKSSMLHDRRRFGTLTKLDGTSGGCSGRETYAPDAAPPVCGPSILNGAACPVGSPVNRYIYAPWANGAVVPGWGYNAAAGGIVFDTNKVRNFDTSAGTLPFSLCAPTGLTGAQSLTVVMGLNLTAFSNVSNSMQAGVTIGAVGGNVSVGFGRQVADQTNWRIMADDGVGVDQDFNTGITAVTAMSQLLKVVLTRTLLTVLWNNGAAPTSTVFSVAITDRAWGDAFTLNLPILNTTSSFYTYWMYSPGIPCGALCGGT